MMKQKLIVRTDPDLPLLPLHGVMGGVTQAGEIEMLIYTDVDARVLLIAASAFSKNLFQGVFHRKANDSQVMVVSRVTLIVIALIGAVIALDENSIIFTIVSFAWAGFGATFGPLMLFSLFWKRTTKAGAVAGMLSGGIMVFVWNFLIKPLGGIFAIYELLPAFIISSIFIVAVSLLTAEPDKTVEEEFERAKTDL